MEFIQKNHSLNAIYYKNINFSLKVYSLIATDFSLKKFSNTTACNYSQKNFTKFIFYFLFFFIYFFKSSSLNNVNFKLNTTFFFLKKKNNTLNFLKSPNRFKMARNQLTQYKNCFKINICIYSTSQFFFNFYSFFFLPFAAIFESNFFFLKTVKYSHLSYLQSLNFFNF